MRTRFQLDVNSAAAPVARHTTQIEPVHLGRILHEKFRP
jgi:hypothetical protein